MTNLKQNINNNIYLMALGCPRNLVDSEVLQGELVKHKYVLTSNPENAGVLIVNTCAFVESAKKEAIDAVLALADIKKKSPNKKLIVTGCFPQRYSKELLSEIPEIDAIFGTSDFLKIPQKIKKWNIINDINVSGSPNFLYDDKDKRIMFTAEHYAYLKIQEGCKNFCSYCVIPKIRGEYRSRTISSIEREAIALRKLNIKEIILIGQDTTLYGYDKYGTSKLSTVINKVTDIMHDRWVRLLYAHPAHIKVEDIKAIADSKSMCKYIDLPIQHINDRILKKMNRYTTKKKIISLIETIRKIMPTVTLRTSLIVGFPGETKSEFKELVQFVKDMRFEKLGAFEYSREEGTPAYSFKDQISANEKRERADKILKVQQKISLKNNQKKVGKTFRVLIEKKDKLDGTLYYGRTQMDAPEIDGICYVRSKKKIIPGTFKDVCMTDALEYDLIGEVK